MALHGMNSILITMGRRWLDTNRVVCAEPLGWVFLEQLGLSTQTGDVLLLSYRSSESALYWVCGLAVTAGIPCSREF